MENLNFVLRDDNGSLPKTLFGMAYIDGVAIRNCLFAVHSSTGKNKGIFDAYKHWKNLSIHNCKFISTTDAGSEGGVWLRNSGGTEASETAVIRNCYFEKVGKDEILGVFGTSSKDNVVINSVVRDVKIFDNFFRCKAFTRLEPH